MNEILMNNDKKFWVQTANFLSCQNLKLFGNLKNEKWIWKDFVKPKSQTPHSPIPKKIEAFLVKV